MGNAIAAAIGLLALLSRRFLAKLVVARHSPFGWLVPAVAAAVVLLAPQMPDMIAGLAEDNRPWPTVGFGVATVLLGWSGWHWMRAVIAARLGAETREDWHRFARSRPALDLADAEAKERAIETAPRAAIIAAGLVPLAAVLASYGADARGFSLGFWEIAILCGAVLVGRLAPIARRKLVEREWFRRRVLERQWMRRLGAGGGGAIRAWEPASGLGAWFRELGPHLMAVLRAAPFGAPFALAWLAAVPAQMVFVAWWPEHLPAAPTAAVLALACLIPPLTLLHAALARLPVPAPAGFALGLVLAMLFVAPWNPPSVYSARQMASGSEGKAKARPELPAALRSWREACLPEAANGSPRPVVILAAEGGASRGALWLLSAMKHLDEQTGGDFGRHIFAISAVSGGSLGAATYLAAQRAAPGADGCGVDWTRVAPATDEAKNALHALGRRDFLAPAVATYFLTDTLRRLLPVGAVLAPVSPADRAVALERSFERYWAEAFPGHGRAGIGLLDARPPGVAEAPHLLLNGTDAEAGRRLITSTFRFGSKVKDNGDEVVKATGDVLFADADDMLAIARRDVPLSAAVTNSARFPFISPAGRFLYRDSPPPETPAATGPESAAPRREGGGIAGAVQRYAAIAWAPVAVAWRSVRRWSCVGAEWWAGSDWEGACEPDADLRQVVDGGYFENYGALTALELARKVRALGGGALLPVVVVVSNDADRPADLDDPDLLACEDPRPVPGRPKREQARSFRQGDPAAHSELLAPLLGLYATRAAHGLAAMHALRRDLCANPAAAPDRRDFVHIALPQPRRDAKEGEEESAPMNWVLNAAARRLILQTGFESKFNRTQTAALCRSLGQEPCANAAPPPAQVTAGSAGRADGSGSDQRGAAPAEAAARRP